MKYKRKNFNNSSAALIMFSPSKSLDIANLERLKISHNSNKILIKIFRRHIGSRVPRSRQGWYRSAASRLRGRPSPK